MSDAAGTPATRVAFEKLGRLLAAIGWQPVPDEAVTGYHVDFEVPELPISSAFAGVTDAGQFILYLNFRLLVDAARRDEVAGFIARANWDLIIGNFEVDVTDGHLRFKSSLDLGTVEWNEAQIRNTILAAMQAVDRYSDGLIDVAARGKPAAAAFHDVSSD